MRISPKMINWLEVLKTTKPPKEGEPESPGFFLAPYMEYPPMNKKLRYVMQWHIRGRSVHTDWRMEANDHLVGWTVLTPGGIPETAHTVEKGKEMVKKVGIEFNKNNKNKGFRAETKARQPKVWLTVEGVVAPGQVGATKEHPGVFVIVDKGQVYFGCQKPYFHEYFLKSDSKDMPFGGDDWTRVVVRAVNVQVIDPETKRPKPGTELMWRVMVPSDQEPYALSRGMEKKWVPPKDYIPIPPEWRKGEKYEKWLAWVKEQWKKGVKSEEEESKQAKFTVGYLSYMGQIVVRGIPNQRWFLRIKMGDKVYSWICDYDVTRFSPLPLEYEGVVDKKWFDYEGDVPPNTKYNPSKTLTGKMYVIDEGTCIVDEKTEDGIDVWDVDFNGQHLKGKVRITQEEEKSPIYTFERLSQETMQLEEAKFVLQEHEIETSEGLKKHWDIRISKGFEFNIWGNPLDLKEEGQGVRALYKICRQIEKWMAIKEPKTKMMVGDLVTYVTPVDEGTVNLIDVTPPRFISMEFNGKKLKGYFVYIEREGQGIFERAKVPHPLAGTGDPAKGDFFKPFNVIKKQGWDYYWLEIYDHRAFTRCEPSYKEYLPDLEVPKQILDILVCLYPRPGTIHGARVSRVKVSDEWSVEEATKWIKKNKLHTWQGEQIRKRHSLEDEMLKKIIEEELEKRKKTPEERQLELELKKKKLELIEKWLKAQEEQG
jgi:hypothetical protein